MSVERVSRRRIALFTHDAYGLGHVRRSVRIMRALAAADPDATMLLVTGSPATQALRGLPPRADWVKIPTIVTSGGSETKPPTLEMGVAELAALRGHIVKETLAGFAPDVFLVDNFPLGTRLELLPALREMRVRGVRTALGLRDVVDPPEKVRKDWARDGLYDVIERHYDRILVYGARGILDAVREYALPPRLAERVHYCGLVTPDAAPRPAEDVRREAGMPEGFLLATVGGGGDGLPLLMAFMDAYPSFPDRPALIVGGEFMGARDREALRVRAAAAPGVTLVESVADLPSLLAAAGAVVAMGGYNTCAEIVAARARAVIVPRSWRSGEHGSRETAKADGEQLHRARGLAAMGLVEIVEPQELSASTLVEALRRAIARPPSPATDLPLDGAARVAAHLLDLCDA